MDEPERRRATITVDGTPYVLPPVDSLSIDEARVLYDYSGLTYDQVLELEGLHPGAIGGLLHVAIQRSDAALRRREIQMMVGSVNMMAVLEELAEIEVPDPTPGGAPSPEPDSEPRTSGSADSSGDDGATASEIPQEPSLPDSTGSLDLASVPEKLEV